MQDNTNGYRRQVGKCNNYKFDGVKKPAQEVLNEDILWIVNVPIKLFDVFILNIIQKVPFSSNW